MGLTDLQIRKLKAPETGQKTMFDPAMKNFGVRVSQGGTKTFIVLLGNERKRQSLGRYPDLSLSDARLLAKEAQVAHARRALQPVHVASDVSSADARTLFLTDCDRRNKASTAAEYRRLLQKYFPFGGKLAAVETPQIVAAIDRLSGAPSEQKHAFVAIRTMMNWCVKRGMIDHSPVPPLSFPVASRERILSDEELRVVWRRAVEFGYPYGRIIQFLILTGQRRGEIAGLKWGWIGEDTITLPGGFTKNKRAHMIPITPLVLDVLEGLPESDELLFPARGRENRPFSGWSKSKPKFDEAIEVRDYTLHDLRRTFSSNMARLGTPIHVTEKLLNHVSGTLSGVAAVYNRYSYLDEMREALRRHEDFLIDLTRS